ncbi:hypothetical protein DRO26_02510, partial [Candidatus Bathyarchaeota archaeon]
TEKVKLPRRRYPIAVKDKDSSIEGKLLLNLSRRDLEKIDEWEETPNNLYVRVKVEVYTDKGKTKAYVYLANPDTPKHMKLEL